MADELETTTTKPKKGVKGAGAPRQVDEYGLGPKERLFVEEYLVTFNATSAAILAGYAPRQAASTGSDLLRKPKIMAVVEKRKRERLARLQIMQDEALLELRNLVTSDLTHFKRVGSSVAAKAGVEEIVSPEGKTIPRTRALSKIKVKSRTYMENETQVEEHEVEITAHSKTSALDMYLKHLGMFPSTSRSVEIADSEGNTLVIEEIVE